MASIYKLYTAYFNVEHQKYYMVTPYILKLTFVHTHVIHLYKDIYT